MREPVRPLDLSFLLMERPGLPMHYSGLSILDTAGRAAGPLTDSELRGLILRRLKRLPRLRRRVDFPLLPFAQPAWVDAAVDARAHIWHHQLVSGEPSELLSLAAELHQRPLDRARPLWELHLIDGLAGGRQALLMKVHHSIADGLGGVEIAEALFDRQPRLQAAATREPGRSPGWLTVLQAAAGVMELTVRDLVAPAGFFNVRNGPRRALALATFPAHRLAAAKRALGATVDDALLTLVAAAMTQYFDGDAPEALRVMVPISTRGGGHGVDNRVTAMFLQLPLGLEPAATAARIAARKNALRRVHEGLGLSSLVELTGHFARPVQQVLLNLATTHPVTGLVVSDIPGPPRPYRLLGATVECMFPLMPLAPQSALSIAALTVGGVTGLAVTSDADRVPDPGRIAAGIESALEALAPRRRPASPPRTSRRSRPRSAGRSRAASASGSASARPAPRRSRAAAARTA